MPFATTAAADAALDAVVATFPDDGTYRLYFDTPSLTTELTADGGYLPAAHGIADWAAASAGVVTTAAPVSFGTSTDAYSDVATWWGIADAAGNPVYYDLLPDQVGVYAAGTVVEFTPALFFRSDV
jgi:hypothetical protein